jgi:spore protease
MKSVCAAAPGVLGVTGLETAEVLRGMVEHVQPDAVIAVDALAARSSQRICSTIQIADTGITPGSGVGNARRELSQAQLGVPVIAVGVPTVVDMHTIVRSYTDADIDAELPNMLVTPRDIDRLTERASQLIAFGINLALQPTLTLADVQGLF